MAERIAGAPGRHRPPHAKVIGVVPPEARASRQRLFGALEHVFPMRFEGREAGHWAGLHGALVFGAEVPPHETPCPVLLVPAMAPAGEGQAEVDLGSEPPLDQRLRGRRLAQAQAQRGLTVPMLPGDIVMASSSGLPLWVRRLHGEHWCDVTAAAPGELAADETLREQLLPGRWLATLPLIHFLREVAGEDAWSGPALRAAFVFDDPNLHATSYGHFKFRELVDHAKRHGYHAVFASIPLDYRFASPRAAEVFRNNPDVVSLCVHGNNHVADELGRIESQAEAITLAAQALRRAAGLEARAGIEVSRIMVPPHEACSEQMMRGLLLVGFEGMCLESPFHRRCAVSVPPSWALAEWYAGDFVVGGLATIPRYPLDRTRDELVLRAYLDQPLVLYGHHGDVAAGLDVLAATRDYIAGLGDAAWMSLQDIARSNYATRREGSLLHVRPFSQRITLSGLDDVGELAVDVPATASALAVRVQSEGAAWQELTIDSPTFKRSSGGHVTIELVPTNLIPAESVDAPPWRPWPLARRIITETRDRSAPLVSRF